MGLSDEVLSIPKEGLRLVVERPYAWEVRLLELGIRWQIESSREQRLEVKHRIPPGRRQFLDEHVALDWLRTRLSELEQETYVLKALFEQAAAQAVAGDGEDSDAFEILTVCKGIGNCYRRALSWSLDFRKTWFSGRYERLMELAAEASLGIVRAIEESHGETWVEIQKKLALSDGMRGEQVIKIGITLDDPFPSELHTELAKITNEHGAPDA